MHHSNLLEKMTLQWEFTTRCIGEYTKNDNIFTGHSGDTANILA